MANLFTLLVPAFAGFMTAALVAVLALMFAGGRIAQHDEALVKQHMPRQDKQSGRAFRPVA